ncbi:hypothetical protein [Archangium sp.]|jgi:hypothetical protein|uniref:hypothetical protein n=1 Tax=Archangium sp. TaxID=1872627 RepID=UPI002ED99D4A
MRGNIRKWMVVGALASAALLFPGCQDTNRGVDQGGMQDQTGTGGAGGEGIILEDQEGIGGSGGTGGTKGGAKGTTGGGSMARDAGTAPMDAGTGGAGFEDQDLGTQGGGVTGGGSDVGSGDIDSDTGGSGDVHK